MLDITNSDRAVAQEFNSPEVHNNICIIVYAFIHHMQVWKLFLIIGYSILQGGPLPCFMDDNILHKRFGTPFEELSRARDRGAYFGNRNLEFHQGKCNQHNHRQPTKSYEFTLNCSKTDPNIKLIQLGQQG